MKLFPSLQKRYAKERFTAVQAQRLAQEIAFGGLILHGHVEAVLSAAVDGRADEKYIRIRSL